MYGDRKVWDAKKYYNCLKKITWLQLPRFQNIGLSLEV
jgi:hypothetical protein